MFVFNVALGRVRELYNRVKSNDPANAALVLVALEFAGLEAESVLIDKDTLADVLSGATNEQTTVGRIVLTDADLAALPAPDDGTNTANCAIPTRVYTAATGNRIGAIIVCYDPDTTSGTDANVVPLTYSEWDQTPSGSDIEITGGDFFVAEQPA